MCSLKMTRHAHTIAKQKREASKRGGTLSDILKHAALSAVCSFEATIDRESMSHVSLKAGILQTCINSFSSVSVPDFNHTCAKHAIFKISV